MSHTSASEQGLAAHAVLFASPVVGVVSWNELGHVVGANAAFRTTLDWPENAPEDGIPLEQFVSPQQRIRFGSSLREIANSRGCRVFELACVGRDKKQIPMLVAAVGASSPPKGGLCLFFDVTPESEVERSELTQRMASLGQFAAGVAHEVNNPLAYAMGNLSFAIEYLQGLTDSTPELSVVLAALRDALEGAERVRRTVRDLKMFARPDSDRQGPVDVERALRAAISMATIEIRHRAHLALDLDVVPPARANESHLAHVFLNLLLNAAHSIAEGAIEKNEIRVTVRGMPPDRLLVEIKDTGRGIPARALGDVLDPFPIGRLTDSGGLGLAICHRLVNDWGGEILVESEVGAGSTFKVVLTTSKEIAESVPSMPLERTGRQRARVLVVDDEPRIGSAISRILDPVHEVTSVYTAEDAIGRLSKGEQFDVILCDVLMPQMNGHDLYRSVEQIAPQFVNRIIFMTGGPFSTRGASFLESVPNPRLEKPFSPETLRALVQRSLQ